MRRALLPPTCWGGLVVALELPLRARRIYPECATAQCGELPALMAEERIEAGRLVHELVQAGDQAQSRLQPLAWYERFGEAGVSRNRWQRIGAPSSQRCGGRVVGCWVRMVLPCVGRSQLAGGSAGECGEFLQCLSLPVVGTHPLPSRVVGQTIVRKERADGPAAGEAARCSQPAQRVQGKSHPDGEEGHINAGAAGAQREIGLDAAHGEKADKEPVDDVALAVRCARHGRVEGKEEPGAPGHSRV